MSEFQLFPAIDLYQGHCVRLFKGDYNAKTEYSANPRQVAEEFIQAGAKWLHVVDLDAAKTGGAENRPVIQEIASLCKQSQVSIQVGGGVRSEETIDTLLSLGVTRVVIGTAVTNTDWMEAMATQFGGARLVAGLDGRGGKLAVRGWLEQTDVSLVELAQILYGCGVTTALVTDVDKDGTLTGPNLTLAKQIQEAAGGEVLASGGVSSLADVLAARDAGLAGAIVGRAIYDGRVDIHVALERLKGESSC